MSDATSWFHRCDCMSVEGPDTGRGLKSTSRPINDRSYIGTCSGNNEHKPYCERQGDGGHLHGYHDHLSGESDPQEPQTGDLSPGAYNTGCNGCGVVSNQITTFGQ